MSACAACGRSGRDIGRADEDSEDAFELDGETGSMIVGCASRSDTVEVGDRGIASAAPPEPWRPLVLPNSLLFLPLPLPPLLVLELPDLRGVLVEVCCEPVADSCWPESCADFERSRACLPNILCRFLFALGDVDNGADPSVVGDGVERLEGVDIAFQSQHPTLATLGYFRPFHPSSPGQQRNPRSGIHSSLKLRTR